LIASLPSLLAASAPQGFQGDVLHLIAGSGAVARLVLAILLGFSVLALSVMIDRFRLFKRARRGSFAFLEAMDQTRNLADLRDRADRYLGSPLVPLFKAGFKELTSQALGGDERRFPASGPMVTEGQIGKNLERIRRVLDRVALSENERLEAYLPVLATTGAVTPFVGLFGTVWGIMNAFTRIGAQGSASLAAVAPGISEALITTAAGLIPAISAVIAYNYFSGKLRQINTIMDEFILRFIAIAEQHLESASVPGALEAGKRRV
jgi:biopolymer transport protein TolQ